MLAKKQSSRKVKVKEREDKCRVNLKNKCHIRRRLKPRDKTLFRKEKGLVEKEATYPSFKEGVQKFR